MKVLEIIPDENFPSLLPSDAQRYLDVVTVGGFSGRTKASTWEELDFHVDRPMSQRGDIFSLTAGAFGFTERVRAELDDLFSEVGETLPIRIGGVRHYVLNVLRRVDALDLGRSEYQPFKNGKIATISRYVFVPAAVENERIFFIKQLASTLFTTTDHEDPSRDFYRRVIEAGYSGLNFRLAWSG